MDGGSWIFLHYEVCMRISERFILYSWMMQNCNRPQKHGVWNLKKVSFNIASEASYGFTFILVAKNSLKMVNLTFRFHDFLVIFFFNFDETVVSNF